MDYRLTRPGTLVFCVNRYGRWYTDVRGYLWYPADCGSVGRQRCRLGTVLAFMMAVTALSLPSLILLKQVVKLPLLSPFVGIVFVGILVIGYSLNSFGYWFL